MIELPFSNGVVGAFVFLLFELIVFPILMESTSKLASLACRIRAATGTSIHVKSMSFPFWNDGLLHGIQSHRFLLLIRIIFITIPVYLETRLISLEVNDVVLRFLEYAYIVAPQSNWSLYQSKTGVKARILQSEAEFVFDKCTHLHEDHVLIAEAASVTYSSNRELQDVECLTRTARPIYRMPVGLPTTVNDGIPPVHKRPLWAEVSLVAGWYDAFPPSPERDSWDGDIHSDPFFQVQNIRTSHASGVDCFVDNAFGQLSDALMLILMCEEVMGRKVDFYQAFVIFPVAKTAVSKTEKSLVSIRSEKAGDLVWLGRMEFESDVLVTCRLLMSAAKADHSIRIPYNEGEFKTILRQVLYSRADDIVVQETTNTVSTHTVLDSTFVTTAAIEIGVVLLFGALVHLCFRHEDVSLRPNVVEGLSQSWIHMLENKNSGSDVLNLEKKGRNKLGVEVWEPGSARDTEEERCHKPDQEGV